MADRVCPCCGKAVGILPMAGLVLAVGGPLKKKIMGALVEQYPTPLSLDHIVTLLYAGDPNGGPDDPYGSIAGMLHQMRPRIIQMGWLIKNIHPAGACKGEYVLRPIDERSKLYVDHSHDIS